MHYFLPIAVLSLIVVSGCRERVVNATTFVVKGMGSNVFPIEKLFELDGCNVYKFNDGNRIEYLSTCPRVSCVEPVCPTPIPTPEPKGGHHRKLQDGEDELK